MKKMLMVYYFLFAQWKIQHLTHQLAEIPALVCFVSLLDLQFNEFSSKDAQVNKGDMKRGSTSFRSTRLYFWLVNQQIFMQQERKMSKDNLK